MGSGELASVMVRLTADASDFIATMDQASDKLKGFAIGAGVLEGAGLAIAGGLAYAAESTAKYEAEIFNLNQRTGIATETLSGLTLAAEAQGKTMDSVQVALRKLGQEAEDALVSPYSKAAATFRDLNVSLYDSNGRVKELGPLLLDVSDAFSHTADSVAKTGQESDMYGRSSMALVPVLATGRDTIAEFGKIAEETGVSVSKAEAEQGKAFMLMQQMAEASLRGVAIAIGNVLLPSFIELMAWMKEHLEMLSGMIRQYPVVIEWVKNLALSLIGTGGLALAVAAVGGAVTLLTTVLGVSAGAIVAVGAAIVGTTTLMLTFKHEIGEVILLLGASLTSVLSKFISGMAEVAGAVGMKGLQEGLNIAKGYLDSATEAALRWDDQIDHQMKTTDSFGEALKKLMGALKGTEGAHTDNMNAIREHDAAVKALVESVTMEKGGYDELTPALEQLMGMHVDDYRIIEKLGPKIIEYTNTRLQEGKTINEVLQYYRDLAINVNTANGQNERLFELLAKIAGIHIDPIPSSLAPKTAEFESHLKTMAELLNDDSRSADTLAKKQIEGINDTLAAETTFKTKLEDIHKAEAAMKIAMDSQYMDYYGRAMALKIMETQGASEADVAIQKDEIAKSLAIFHQFEQEMTRLKKLEASENTRYWQQFVTTGDQALAKMEVSMAHAMGDITTGFAQALAQDIVHWNNWGSSLVSLAQSVASQLLQAFMVGFLNPLTNALQSVGRSLANMLFNAIGTGLGILGGGIGAGGADLFLGGATGFAAQGAVLDKDMAIFAHAGEMILPPDLSRGMQDMIRGNDGPARLSPSDSAASMSPTVGPTLDSGSPASYAMPQAASMVGGGDMTPVLAAIREALSGLSASSQMNDRTGEEANSILGQILNAIKQGQKIVVNGQVLGQTAATALRSRTLVAGAVAQAGR